MRQRLIGARLAAQQGFTTVVVIFTLLIGSLLVAAAFTTANGDIGIKRHDQYYKQAYDAAEAGVNYYLAHLVQNTDYWSTCYTSPINPPGTAFSTSTSQQIPGSEGRYEIELLKPPNSTAACSTAAPRSSTRRPGS